MNTMNQSRTDAQGAGEALSSQYHTMLEGWAEVSRCCLAAADNIYHTGIEYIKDQTDHWHEVARDPGAVMREQTYSRAISCSFDAADKIAHAYLESIETVREPLMRAVSAQVPLSRTVTGVFGGGIQRGLETGLQAVQQGAETMERGARGVTREAERGAEKSQQASHHSHSQHARRKSA